MTRQRFSAAGVEQTASFAREYDGAASGRISTWLAPHAPYTCDGDFLAAVAAEAERLDLGIHIHAAETSGQTEASLEAHGRTPIEILARAGVLDRPTILAHCCGVTGADIEVLAGKPCGVAHAPKTYLKLAMGAAPLRALRAAGIPVGLATDGPVSNNTLDILESLRLMALVAKHESGDPRDFAVGEVLDIATRGSARVFGLPNDLGQVAPRSPIQDPTLQSVMYRLPTASSLQRRKGGVGEPGPPFRPIEVAAVVLARAAGCAVGYPSTGIENGNPVAHHRRRWRPSPVRGWLRNRR